VSSKLYPDGADVYMRRVKASERVRVPGKGNGLCAPLVVARESVLGRASIQIERVWNKGGQAEKGFRAGEVPRDAKYSGSPGETVRFIGYASPYDIYTSVPLTASWSVHEGDGWKRLESAEYVLPWTSSPEVKCRFELVAPDGVVECQAEATITVVNKADCALYYPNAKASFAPGEWTNFSWTALDVSGQPVPPEKVGVRARSNGKDVGPLGNKYYAQAPEVAGTWDIIFEWESAPGHAATKAYSFTVRKRK
jgi:hypothetical protein